MELVHDLFLFWTLSPAHRRFDKVNRFLCRRSANAECWNFLSRHLFSQMYNSDQCVSEGTSVTGKQINGNAYNLSHSQCEEARGIINGGWQRGISTMDLEGSGKQFGYEPHDHPAGCI